MRLPFRSALSAAILPFCCLQASAQAPGPFSVLSPDPQVQNPNSDYEYFITELSSAEAYIVESSGNVPQP